MIAAAAVLLLLPLLLLLVLLGVFFPSLLLRNNTRKNVPTGTSMAAAVVSVGSLTQEYLVRHVPVVYSPSMMYRRLTSTAGVEVAPHHHNYHQVHTRYEYH